MNRHREIPSSGFTLVEILLAMVIMGFMLTATVTSMGTSSRSQGASAIADALAAEIRAARSQAMATGWPTAIGIPSSGGKIYAAQGFYELEGPVLPRVTRTRSFESEAKGVYLSVATWAKSSGGDWLRKSPETGSGFVPDAWSPPFPEDFLLLFLPSGQVLSNGWSYDENGYSIVVSNGVTATVGTGSSETSSFTDTPPDFQISGAANPYTVTVGLDGTVSTHKGLGGTSSGVAETGAGGVEVAALPPMSAKPTALPELVKMDGFPKQILEEPNSPIAVAQDGFLSLVVDAWSPEGVPLFAEWGGDGRFSSAEATPLEWNPTEGVWRGRVEWKPPATAKEGDEYQLNVRVKDRYGHLNAGGDVGVLKIVVTKQPWRVAYLKDGEIWRTEMDGSGQTKLCEGTFLEFDVSADGSKLVATTPDVVNGNNTLVLVIPGVGIVRTLAPSSVRPSSPTWSPSGEVIFYNSSVGLSSVRPDGSNTRAIGSPSYGNYAVDSRGTKLVVKEGRDIITMDADGSNRKKVASGWFWGPSLSPDGSEVAFAGEFPCRLYVVPANGGAIETLASNISDAWTLYANIRLSWSPDGSKVLFPTLPSPIWNNPNGITVVERATKTLKKIPDSKNHGKASAYWSPDGSQLLGLNSSKGELVLMKPDGSGQTVLAPGYVSDCRWIK